MTAIAVFDPAMCCSTGICGPSVDPKLARFAADLDWLKSRGVTVERFNLAQQPAAFADDAAVKSALQTLGDEALPLVKVNGKVKSSGVYPSRDDLAAWAGVSAPVPVPEPIVQSAGCCGPATTTASGLKKSGCC